MKGQLDISKIYLRKGRKTQVKKKKKKKKKKKRKKKTTTKNKLIPSSKLCPCIPLLHPINPHFWRIFYNYNIFSFHLLAELVGRDAVFFFSGQTCDSSLFMHSFPLTIDAASVAATMQTYWQIEISSAYYSGPLHVSRSLSVPRTSSISVVMSLVVTDPMMV